MKVSEDLVVLLRRSLADKTIMGIAIAPKQLILRYPYAFDCIHGENVERWPITFLGSNEEVIRWVRTSLNYYGCPNG